MTVYLVGAGPGDPELITVRGQALLELADVVVFDRLVDTRLLDIAPSSAELVDVGKPSHLSPEGPDQDAINAILVDAGRRHPTVVRLKGGDPFVYGRGGEELAALRAAGITCEVVPGVSAAFAAPASVGIPVTHRGVSSAVTVVTGSAIDENAVDWDAVATTGGTIVVMMGAARRAKVAARLIAAGRAPEEAVAIVMRATTGRQAEVRATLGTLADVEVEAPATFVIGPVVGLVPPPGRSAPQGPALQGPAPEGPARQGSVSRGSKSGRSAPQVPVPE